MKRQFDMPISKPESPDALIRPVAGGRGELQYVGTLDGKQRWLLKMCNPHLLAGSVVVHAESPLDADHLAGNVMRDVHLKSRVGFVSGAPSQDSAWTTNGLCQCRACAEYIEQTKQDRARCIMAAIRKFLTGDRELYPGECLDLIEWVTMVVTRIGEQAFELEPPPTRWDPVK